MEWEHLAYSLFTNSRCFPRFLFISQLWLHINKYTLVTGWRKEETISVPVVYKVWEKIILMQAISITRAIGRGGPLNRFFFGPWNGNKRSGCHMGPKKLRFQGPLFPMACMYISSKSLYVCTCISMFVVVHLSLFLSAFLPTFSCLIAMILPVIGIAKPPMSVRNTFADNPNVASVFFYLFGPLQWL